MRLPAAPLRVAILGVGRMGRRHIEAVRRVHLDLVGVFDLSAASLESARAEASVPPEALFGDSSALFEKTNPECVIIATTADSHCELTCLAAERGARFVLVEKPMAVSLNECDRMIETCAKHGTRLAVNHQMRFMEQYTLPKELGSTDAYGGLASMTVVAGNFGFSMNGIHYFEAFRYLTNESMATVSAWFSSENVSNPRGAQFEDRAGCIRAETQSGKRLYMDLGSDQGHGVHVVYGCRNGFIAIDELSGRLHSVVREERHRALPTTRYGMPAIESDFAIAPADVIEPSADVLRALLAGPGSVSGEDGRQAIAVLVAAYQSAESGGAPVRIDQSLPAGRRFPWA